MTYFSIREAFLEEKNGQSINRSNSPKKLQMVTEYGEIFLKVGKI